ncbi:unnamed protein product [Schistosoma turkestanicum]|nr:unnamed protein product [Schistosoma turkestanicum]
MEETQLSNDFNFTSKTITTNVVDEYGNSIISTVKTKKRRSGKYCLHLFKIFIKNIGLTLLLIAYLCAGGYIFRSLELYNESQDCFQRQKNYIKKLNSTTLRVIGTIKSIDSNNNHLDQTQTLDEIIINLLNEYAEDLYALDVKPSTNCTAILNTSDGSKWNLINAIFFCVTVITTIGYGHIAPVTFWGRITCIIYAIIGIPLMLIYLAIIGNLLARGFRTIFLNLICCRCFYDIIKRKRQQRRKLMRQWEESLRLHEEEEARRRGLSLPPKKIQSNIDDDYDSDDDEDDENRIDDGAKLHVPLTISVIVLSIYTIIGAMIFPTWEDWSTANAAYFSFITISTIGFGDLVPGNGRFNDPKTTTELVVGGLYLLVGLSLLSMCLNLMKDEIIAKVHYICTCIGLKSKKTNNNNNEDDDDNVNVANNLNNNNSNQQLNNIEQLNKETTQLMTPAMATTTTTTKRTTTGQSSNYQKNEYDNEAFQIER